ncbi:MAG: 2'-5' RNA ligase [Acidobacteria bacterium RIFCSPLOWO2_02_FULL_67_36]|nr:MAG: 2'-5' RNA ligase [Acidobacteria bacterium RIFCSPLOWO2_02_FULL_67_36]OFW18411.1 MAG: 2'-5' RNA ligase [Acidobacteria bacterium RIFCSPLOWO2_12_FULL_66_21]
MDKPRLFVAIELDDSVRAAAARAAEALAGRLSRSRPDLDARWVDAANLHITLWFIGHVGVDHAQAIQQAVADPFHIAPFDLHVTGFGAFPPSGAPRVFWLGVQEGQDSMRAVYEEVSRRLQALGYEPERRPYSAHLTVARVKDPGRGGHAELRRVLGDTPGDAGVSRIAAVTVFRSHLSPKGATYEPLLRVPLQ